MSLKNGYLFPRPSDAEKDDHNYPLEWVRGELENIPDFSDFERIKELLSEGKGIDSLTVYAKTDSGRIYRYNENLNSDRGSLTREHRELGLLLAGNDITFKNGNYVTEDQLIEAGVVENNGYRNAWDVIYGRPDSILHLGNGIITFNDTGSSFPWDEEFYFQGEEYGDITSYDKDTAETVRIDSGARKPELLRPPLDLLKQSWELSKDAFDFLEEGKDESLRVLINRGVANDDWNEEPRFDEEPFPNPPLTPINFRVHGLKAR